MKYQGITIFKNKSCNTWYTRFRRGGKSYYISARTQQECYNKLKAALNKLHKLELKKEFKKLQEPKAPPQMKFIDWYNKWLELYKKDIKDSTKRVYKSCLTHLTNIVNKPINQITSIDIMEELNRIPGERTRQKVYEFAKDVFTKALANEILTKNPFVNVIKPKHKKINGLALSNADEKVFENLCKKYNYDCLLVCLYQGLRRGEMLAITNDDVDVENKTLTINKAINCKNQLDTTKNSYSERIIPLFDVTLEVLKKYKNVEGRIFNIKYKTAECYLRKIKAEGKLNDKYTIHSLRHTFITKCQEKNVALHIIQKWVGHNIGSEVTARVYTHSRELAELESLEKMNN